ncbi:MAG: extracellular solute-binding protein [Eubacteriales bacterium]
MIDKIYKHIKKIYLGIIFLFLYAPIITLVVMSFNNTKTRSVWGGFTLDWYVSLIQNEEIISALYTTLTIATLSALIATAIGTMAAIGIQSMKRRSRTTMLAITNIPMLNADIVTGISLMLFFITFRVGIGFASFEFTLGFTTVLLAHITFNIPYVILSVLPKLRQTSKSTYEAALDLGASPLQAFFKVVFPDILPGVFSGFLLAFTMSLDDFVITHFTKGPGVETLSTIIYTEVRKGINPEMYALSSILFVVVLLLLIVINADPQPNKNISAMDIMKKKRRNTLIFKRILPSFVISIIVIVGVSSNLSLGNTDSNQLLIYNWGEYMDPDVITLFEEETGIDVIYEEYETNESMYPKVASGAIAYDLICPSDYMIERMIEEDMLYELNFDNIPNIVNIDPTYMEQSLQFDSTGTYSVPYCWGTVGILYNTTLVDEPVTSWSILWDEQYAGEILMQDSVRDTLGIALKYLGYSLNSTDLDELYEAQNLLLDQKDLVQAYVIDQVRDKMISGEAAIGVIYSGEALYTQSENPDLAYVIPEEGSNIWIDSWVIPKISENKENAEAFINFLCRADIALMNFEYITYSTPNQAAWELIEDEELKYNPTAFPDSEDLADCETFSYLGTDATELYNSLWLEIKSK